MKRSPICPGLLTSTTPIAAVPRKAITTILPSLIRLLMLAAAEYFVNSLMPSGESLVVVAAR